MTRRYGKGDRGSREKRKPKRPRAPDAKVEPRTVPHRLYGDIPLVPCSTVLPSGERHQYLDYDPDYEPPLPEGAVRGDVRRQHFCPICHTPKYFYVDQERTCVECGVRFVFRAREQKHWFETLHFHFDSVAIRCPPCRRRRRSDRALEAQYAAARAALDEAPDDPGRLLAFAEMVARYHQRTGRGGLDAGIAAARKAAKRWPEAPEALFWQGLCQLLAGRTAPARAAFEAFSARAVHHRRLANLAREAQRYLENAG